MLGEQVVGLRDDDLVHSGAAVSAAYANSESMLMSERQSMLMSERQSMLMSERHSTLMSRATSTDDDIGRRAKDCRRTRWM